MKKEMFGLLLVIQLISDKISVCSGANPCVDYRFIDMVDGLRSSDFDSRLSEVSICDAILAPDTWYRFEDDAGIKLIERPVEPWHCGTTAPIWLNGAHPTDRTEVTAEVCATYSSTNTCGWNGTVGIRLCNESGSEFFVYLLAVPPGCALAYCVDAASRKQCPPPLVWLEEEFRCAEYLVSGTTTPHLTVPLTTLPTQTTLATTSSPSTGRLSLTTTFITSTEPARSGCSTWGPWSICSKLCDYGVQSRRRIRGQLPCDGPTNSYRLCNQYNCQKLPEEETRGIGLAFEYSDSKEDTMLTVVLNQQKIHSILRKNINDMCSQNVSMCCGWRYNGISQLEEEFVHPGDLYPSQGSLIPTTDYAVYSQILAIVNEDINRKICKGSSHRIHARHLKTSPNFISFGVMMNASVKSAITIFQESGLIITAYKDPATMTVHNDDEYADNASCPLLTCIGPIVLCVAVVVGFVVISGLCYAKTRIKSKTEPERKTPKPSQYEEILSEDPCVNVKGLAYIVPVALDVSDNAYYRSVGQEPVDFQNVEVDV